MSQKEIDELLEINSEVHSNTKTQIEGSFIKHFIIHIGILIVTSALSLFFMKNNNSSNEDILYAIVLSFIFLIFLVVLIVETIYYQVSKKYQWRNSALLTIAILIISAVLVIKSNF
jgi:uncharacterized membrane protein